MNKFPLEHDLEVGASRSCPLCTSPRLVYFSNPSNNGRNSFMETFVNSTSKKIVKKVPRHVAVWIEHKITHFWKTQYNMQSPGRACVLGMTFVPIDLYDHSLGMDQMSKEFHSNATHVALVVYKIYVKHKLGTDVMYFCNELHIRYVPDRLMILSDMMDNLTMKLNEQCGDYEGARLEAESYAGTEYVELMEDE